MIAVTVFRVASTPQTRSRLRARTASGPFVAGLLALCLGVAWILLLGSPSAQASCAAQSPPSPRVFTGLVVATRLTDRIATVRLTTGETVEVQGTTVTQENEATSADRAFKVGGRYEFHPVNASSPFSDNACTETVLLGMESVPAAGSSTRWVLAVTVIGAAMAGGVIGALVVVRRRAETA